MKRLITFFLVFWLGSNLHYAQESAPSLSIGLDNVLFGKGVIDVDLLTEIISEKQDELKKRIVEKEILKPVFKNSSFATSNYAFSVVKELMNEKDKTVLKKEVMEHTVNYAVICAFAEMYLQLSWNDMKTGKYFQNLGVSRKYKFYDQIDLCETNDFLNAKLFQSSDFVAKVKNLENDSVDVIFNQLLLDVVFHSVRNNKNFIDKGFFAKPTYFNNDSYLEKSRYMTTKNDPFVKAFYKDVDKFVKDISNLYEMFNEVLKYSSTIKNGGTMKQNSFYDHFKHKVDENEFNIRRSILENSELSVEQSIENYSYQIKLASYELDKLMKEIKMEVSLMSPLFSGNFTNVQQDLLKDMKWKPEYFNAMDEKGIPEAGLDTVFFDVSTSSKSELIESFKKSKYLDGLKFDLYNYSVVAGLMNQMIKKMDEKQKDLMDIKEMKISMDSNALNYLFLEPLESQLQSFALKNMEVTTGVDSILMGLYKHYYFIKSDFEAAKNLNYIYSLKKDLLPKLGYANLKSGGVLEPVVSLFEDLLLYTEFQIYSPIITELDPVNFSERSNAFQAIFSESGSVMQTSYFKFFEKLDQLDQMETYYYLLHDVLEAGELSSNRDVANAMNLILKSVEKYTEFDAENDRIDIDVESVIEALYLKYGNRDKNPFNFYLTVGLNSAFSMGNKVDTTGLNFNFASEKIGLRLNFWNPQLRSSYTQYESKGKYKQFKNEKSNFKSQEPVISNMHFLLYGSGLLYQLTDLSTSKNLNATFVGGGVGMTFYNGLSCNASVMIPVFEDQLFNFQNPYLNVGFDIHFVEYLSALNKKRKENKKEKLQAEMEFELEMKKLEVEKLKLAQPSR